LFFRRLGDGPHAVLIPNGIYLLDDFATLAQERTLIAFDPRNRGQSDQSHDGDKLRGDVHLDVEDLEAVRQHLGIGKVDLIGHSYAGIVVALYTMRYPEHVNRVVQIGPVGPVGGKQYAPPLSFDDGVLASVFTRIGQLQKDHAPGSNPVELCRRMWSVLREIYVADPVNASRVNWDRCDLPNELAFMHYWNANVLPSIMKLHLTEAASSVDAPVLTIHGRKDRSAPCGGGREWALVLPNARLISVDDAGHAPWIEAPEKVFQAIETFLSGGWPDDAEQVTSLDAQSASA
jgi:pimeloyl-ACP methyl ester carboxylesterase